MMEKKLLRTCENCSCVGIGYKRCGKCLNVLYCSELCQRDHWKSHKEQCGDTLNKLKNSNVYIGPDHDLKKQIRDEITKQWDHIKEPHCKICGDTERLCGLKRTHSGILCDDCIRIQHNM